MPTPMDALAWVLQLPTWLAIPALFGIVLLRSHATYWLGRAASAGAGEIVQHTRTEAQRPGGSRLTRGWRRTAERMRSAPSATARRAQDVLRRWGALAVTGAYFTVGLQTAIFAGAGMIRMPYPRFTLASLPGSLGWAFLWFGVGVGAWWAVGRLAGSLHWAVALGAVLLTALAVVVHRRRTRPADAGSALAADR